MALVVNDTFTDTSGTALASHTGETGATWTIHPNYTGTAVISNANRVRKGTGTTLSVFYTSGVPGGAEYDVTGDFYIASTAASQSSIAGRLSLTVGDFYEARATETNWSLRKAIAGVGSILGTWTRTSIDEAIEAAKLEIRDAQKAVYVDGTSRITSTDNAVTGAGRAGVRFGTVAGSDTAQIHIDNFQCNDLAAGGGSALPPQMMAFE